MRERPRSWRASSAPLPHRFPDPILILDEVTSTMRQADRIVVLDGRIAKMGSNEELTSRGGYYGEITLPRRS